GARTVAGGGAGHRGALRGPCGARRLARARLPQRAAVRLAGMDLAQARHPGPRAAAAVDGGDVVGRRRGALAAARAGDGGARRDSGTLASAGLDGTLEPELVHGAPAGDDRGAGTRPVALQMRKAARGPLSVLAW